jgi:hypothetical protein
MKSTVDVPDWSAILAPHDDARRKFMCDFY